RLGTMVGEPAKLDDDGLAELSRFLDFASGQFDLAMVRVDNELDRAALTEWLRARVATLTHLRLDELSENPLARLREKHEIGDVLLLTGLEGGADEAFRALNVQRDRLVEVAPVPWILAGHQQALSVFQQVAPDFCDL